MGKFGAWLRSNFSHPGDYAKALAAAALVAFSTWKTGLADGLGMSGQDWISVAVATVTSFGTVWLLPNQPEGLARWGKAVTTTIVAALGSLAAALPGGISQDEWLGVITVVLSGLIVAAVPNARVSDQYLPRHAAPEQPAGVTVRAGTVSPTRRPLDPPAMARVLLARTRLLVGLKSHGFLLE